MPSNGAETFESGEEVARTAHLEASLSGFPLSGRIRQSRHVALSPVRSTSGPSHHPETWAMSSLLGCKPGRQFAAWLGLTPQHSTRGKTQPSGISKLGDRYPRRLLVAGVTAVIRHTKDKPTPMANSFRKLLEKKRFRIVSVALANRLASSARAVLTRKEAYRPYQRAARGRPKQTELATTGSCVSQVLQNPWREVWREVMRARPAAIRRPRPAKPLSCARADAPC